MTLTHQAIECIRGTVKHGTDLCRMSVEHLLEPVGRPAEIAATSLDQCRKAVTGLGQVFTDRAGPLVEHLDEA